MISHLQTCTYSPLVVVRPCPFEHRGDACFVAGANHQKGSGYMVNWFPGNDSWWFMVIHGHSWWILNVFHGEYWIVFNAFAYALFTPDHLSMNLTFSKQTSHWSSTNASLMVINQPSVQASSLDITIYNQVYLYFASQCVNHYISKLKYNIVQQFVKHHSLHHLIPQPFLVIGLAAIAFFTSCFGLLYVFAFSLHAS